MSDIATAAIEAQRHSELNLTMKRLLHQLRRFMRAYPRVNEPLPDHDMVWVDELPGDGPAKTIHEAIASNPVLWAHALPKEVCIVPRKALESKLSEFQAECLNQLGMNMVMEKAYRRKSQIEER